VNEQLNRQIKRFTKSLNGRSQTEKLMVLVILAVGLILVYLEVFYDPIRAEIASSRSQINSVRAQISSQQTSYAQKLAQSQEDPNKFANDRLIVVEQQQELLLSEISALAGDLITPNQMTALLTNVLARQVGLEMISFNNEPVKPLRAQIAETGQDAADVGQVLAVSNSISGQVYEHGLTIEFEGDFFNTLRYLRFLEGMTGSFFWDSINFSQSEWPTAKVTLMIHTLSADEGFIGA
jgi:MSHA biogenesis protein MshJ